MSLSSLASDPVDARSQSRTSLFLAAVMRTGLEQAPVKLRNLSTKGALVESPIVPAPGTKVDLVRGSLVAHGTVKWSSAIRFGLHFASSISVKEWSAAPTKVHQQRVDEMVALVRAGTEGQAPARWEPRGQELLVDDLGAVIRLMEDLENDLTGSVETLVRHGMKLQNLDIAMQMLRAVANELAPGGPTLPPLSPRLQDLRVSCAQALDQG